MDGYYKARTQKNYLRLCFFTARHPESAGFPEKGNCVAIRHTVCLPNCNGTAFVDIESFGVLGYSIELDNKKQGNETRTK